MKKLSAGLALAALMAASVAGAQTTPNTDQPTPSTQAPTQQSPSAQSSMPDSSMASDSSSDKAARKEQMKDCMQQQKANNPGMSRHDRRKACKDQMSGQMSSSPHN